MFGHTHKPHLEYCRGRPGGPESVEASPTRVRTGRKPSYMLMELDRQGEAHFTICYLEDEARNQAAGADGDLGISVFEEI